MDATDVNRALVSMLYGLKRLDDSEDDDDVLALAGSGLRAPDGFLDSIILHLLLNHVMCTTKRRSITTRRAFSGDGGVA